MQPRQPRRNKYRLFSSISENLEKITYIALATELPTEQKLARISTYSDRIRETIKEILKLGI